MVLATSAQRKGSRRLAIGATLCLAAVVVPLVRQAARPWDSVWAEDGMPYTQDVNAMPLHATLFRGYAGYGQLICRILALPTRFVPVDWIPSYMAVAGSTTAALLALFVYRMSGSHVRSVWARLGLASACILLPALAFENEATVVNLVWILTFTSFWALVSRRSTPADLASRAGIAFLAAASSPVAFLFLPLLACVLWARRGRSDALVGAAYLAGVALQSAMVLATDSEAPTTPASVGDIVTLYPVRVLASALFGERAVRGLWPRWGVGIGTAAAVIAVALVAVAVRAARQQGANDSVPGGQRQHLGLRRRHAALAATMLSFPLVAIPLVIRGTVAMRSTDEVYNAAGARYFVVPVLLLISAAAIITGQATRRWPAVVFAGWVLVVGMSSLGSARDWRPAGPSWDEGVRVARASCEQSSQPHSTVPVAPVGWGAVTLSCSRLQATP